MLYIGGGMEFFAKIFAIIIREYHVYREYHEYRDIREYRNIQEYHWYSRKIFAPANTLLFAAIREYRISK